MYAPCVGGLWLVPRAGASWLARQLHASSDSLSVSTTSAWGLINKPSHLPQLQIGEHIAICEQNKVGMTISKERNDQICACNINLSFVVGILSRNLIRVLMVF